MKTRSIPLRMKRLLAILLTTCLCWNVVAQEDFTCSGGSYTAALSQCPDSGAQAVSSGGNVTILVKSAKNVPNRDASGPAAGVSDPYVRFTVGDIVAETSNVRNDLNPEWNEYVSLGFLGSATRIEVEVWDKDTGLEFADDLLLKSSVRVPFCSWFNADYAEKRCDSVFGCASDDSLWAMPLRKQCNETGEISFNQAACWQNAGVCLFLEFYIVPFTMEVEFVAPGNNIAKPLLSASAPLINTADWTSEYNFGYPFTADFDTIVNTNSPLMDDLKGALMFRTDNDEKSLGDAETIKYYASSNFPADLYVCRFEGEDGVPNWLTSEFNTRFLSIRGVIMASTNNYFGCYQREIAGTVKNKHGGIESGTFAIRSNTVSGVVGAASYSFNSIVLSVPRVDAPRDDTVKIIYDSMLFFVSLVRHGIFLLIFIPVIAKFLKNVDYRVDRVPNWLASRVLTGEDRNILAGAFLCNQATEQNIQYRAHMYHIRNIIYFIFCIPFMIMITWGFSMTYAMRPVALGLAVAFMGPSIGLMWLALSLWRASKWRLSPMAVYYLVGAVGFFVTFLFSVVFADPGVTDYNKAINFTALGLILGTLNCVPLMQLAFKQDRSQTKHLYVVVQKMAAAVFYLKDPGNKKNTQGKEYKDLKINRILHALLGENYTINPKVSVFQFAAAMHELATDDADADGTIDAEEVEEYKKQEAWKLYSYSLVILLVYFIIAAARTNNPSLAFLNILCLTLLDVIHLSMSHGDAKWSPGFMIALLIMGRVLIMGSPVTLWILNYAACYMLYAGLLINEMINTYLPVLSKREAGEIAFTGRDHDDTLNPDMAGTAYFNLLLITLAYSAVLVVASIRAAEDALPVPDLTVLGCSGWNITVFGLIGLLATVTGALMHASMRAYYLDMHGLLRGRLKEVFFLRPDFTVPRILVISTELSILLSGFLIYASTGSWAVLVGAVFLPPIVVTLAVAWKIWVANDYELVPWPRRAKAGTAEAGGDGENPSDLEVAFNLIEDLFGAPGGGKAGGGAGGGGAAGAGDDVEAFEEEDDEDNPESGEAAAPQRTLKGFQLPELKVTGNKVDEIKMPPLPLKSVLRKKRQNLGIKTKMPLVKDLRSRDDAQDNDKFGAGEDVIDAADPWAQFEISEEEELKARREEKRRKALASTLIKKEPFWRHKYFLAMVRVIRQIKAALSKYWGQMCGLCGANNKVFPNRYSVTHGGKDGEDDEDNDEDEEGEGGNGENENTVVPLFDGEGGGESAVSSKSGKPGSSMALSAKPEPGVKKSSKESGTVSSKSAKTTAVVAGKSSKSGKKDQDAGDDNQTADGNNSMGSGDLEAQDEESPLLDVDVDKLPFDEAMWGGYLNQAEYFVLACWYGGLLLIFLFGLFLSVFVDPPWMGQVIWVAMFIFVCTIVPIIKYFNTYTFDHTQQQLAKYTLAVHFLFCLIFFVWPLNADPGLHGSLWLLDFFLYYPFFLFIIFEVYRWYDSDFKFADLDADGDGKISFGEVMNFFRTSPVLIGGVIMFNWQLYVWVSLLVGEVFTLFLIVGVVAYVFLRDWAMNDFYLSPELLTIGRWGINITLFITFWVSVGIPTPMFSISVFCCTLMFRIGLKIGQRLLAVDKETKFFFSPFVLPVYSYDALKQDVHNETDLVLNVFYFCITGVIWGCLMAIFYYPVNVGVALACCFLLILAAMFSLAVTATPIQLAKASTMLTPEGIVEAANAAKEKFEDRKLPINMEMRGWEGSAAVAEVVEEEGGEEGAGGSGGGSGKGKSSQTPLEKLKDRTALSNAVDVMGDVRALTYVREEKMEAANTVELDDVDEFELRWYQQLWVDFKGLVKKGYQMIPFPRMPGWNRHSQSPFSFGDAAMELFITGRGPFGFLSLEGSFYQFFISLRDYPKYERFYPKILDHYDEIGNDLSLVRLTEPLDLTSMLARIRDLDEAVDFTYHEEARTAIHFILMLLVGADVKLQREQVLFQKFLRENRFRLASNGITPPPDIFSSASFSSINIQLVAAWLNTLSADERERFHTLKATFSQEQAERDELIDTSDYEIAFDASNLIKERQLRESYWADKLTVDIAKRKEQRLLEFVESLQGFERQKFANRKELWLSDPECFVDLREMDLYDRFRAAYFAERNDALEAMQQSLIDIETAQKDARLGEYGRAYQYVDSEFMPNEEAIGYGESHAQVLGWRCAPGISEEAMLFDGGTHPDEVTVGIFKDTWLLSAINMLVAAGDFGNGIINNQIKSLFVGHAGPDGEITLLTEVGAYCVQLFRSGEWTPVVVDDLLPMRRKDFWTNENRGMAAAHNKECKGLWVSLIEKAFAKFYGSYEFLEKGYVHHALSMLTGSEAECVPLSAASRGIGKRALWDSLVRYRKNGYILGAGTGDSSLVDKEIQEMGIVFDAAYTIYDVRQVDGHRLLKLRNPPGDHEEWKGDWSDKSPLWTRRLKKKLGHSDAEDDNTFFMAFDDFCNVFRNLYVCKYYNPTKWYEIMHPGVWKKTEEASFDKIDAMTQFMADASGKGQAEKTAAEKAAEDKKRARAKTDSAGGLPTKHNPACVLENNPHYSFRINRPTDFRVSVTQFTNRGRAQLVIQPFSVLIVKNPDDAMAYRLTELKKEDIVYSSGEPVAERTINVYGNGIQPGLYVILVAAYMSGMEGQFKISVLSNYKTEFSPIWPPMWMLKGEREKLNETEAEQNATTKPNERGATAKGPAAKKKTDLRSGLRALFGGGGGDGDDDSSDDDDDDSDEDNYGMDV